jgi:hypothetical protein
MEIKEGVSLQGLRIPMRKVLIAADKIWKRHMQELVITSGTDGLHSPGSLHYYGYALDFRSRYFTDYEKQVVCEELEKELNSPVYRVINEKTHIHVEWRGLIDGTC